MVLRLSAVFILKKNEFYPDVSIIYALASGLFMQRIASNVIEVRFDLCSKSYRLSAI